jgi:DNA-binding NarL/FixJ family response regulator
MRVGVETTLRRSGVNTSQSVSTATEFFASQTAQTATRQRELDHGTEHIDIVVIGALADMTQIAAIRRATADGVSVIVMTSSISPAAVMDLCSAGAHAVVAREASDAELAEAIESVVKGRRYVAPELLGAMFAEKATPVAKPRFDLTTREREVLVELVTGRTNLEISKRLLIGQETVKSHLNNIYDKLDVRRRTHAVSLALAAGLV